MTLGVTLLSDVDAMIDRGVHDDRRLGIEIPGRMGEGRDGSSDGRVLTGKECWLHLQNLGSKHSTAGEGSATSERQIAMTRHARKIYEQL